MYLGKVHKRTSKESLHGRVPLEKRHGFTPDISAYLLYQFYEKIYYLNTEQKYPHTKESLGHFLGVADDIGDALTFYVLAENDQVLVRSVIHSADNPRQFGFANKRIMPDNHTDTNAELKAENTPVLPFDEPIELQLLGKSLDDVQLQGRDMDPDVTPKSKESTMEAAMEVPPMERGDLPSSMESSNKTLPENGLPKICVKIQVSRNHR